MVRGKSFNAIAAALGECRRAFLAVGLFSLCLNLLLLAVPLYSFQIFDRVLTSRSQDTLILLSIAAVGAIAVLAALDALRTQVLARIGAWLDVRLAGHVLGAGVEAAVRGANIGAQGLRDLGQLRAFIGGAGLVALFDAPTLVFYVALTFLIHPTLGWIAIAGTVLLVAIATANLLATRKALNEANAATVGLLNRAHGNIANADTIQAMGMLPALLTRWNRENGLMLRLQQNAGDRMALFGALSKATRLLVQIMTMGVGAHLAIDQQITGGMMIASSIIMARGLAPVETAITSWSAMAAARDAYRRLRQLMIALPLAERSFTLPDPEGRLSVENVTVGLPGQERPILKHISFDLPPGEALAIIGPTGAGKSTLARVLVGAFPMAAGHVRIDGADIASWDRTDLGRHLGYVAQSVELFPGTIAANISRLLDVDLQRVIAAAKAAGVHDLILRMPKGYDTEIGEGGASLSGGMRQRIALARALFGSPRLLVLDEPNANLDAAGEVALQRALAAAKANRISVVLVTHRRSILQRMDKILWLRDGQIMAFGPRDQVLAATARESREQLPSNLAVLPTAKDGT
jgi:PrtD family type I secretion system ABC transporter